MFSLCVGQFVLASDEDEKTTVDAEVQEDAAAEETDESENISLLDILANSILGEEDDEEEINEDEAEHDVGKREVDINTNEADGKTDEDSEDESINDPFLFGLKLAPRRRQSFRKKISSLLL